jgi:hypothetical protein
MRATLQSFFEVSPSVLFSPVKNKVPGGVVCCLFSFGGNKFPFASKV